MKKIITTFFCFCALASYSQVGDMIVIKKNQQTIRSFYKGAMVKFITINGDRISCKVSEIKNDSLFYNDIIIRQMATQYGGLLLDTIILKTQGIHYTEIDGIPRKKEAFTYIKNGALFKIGGAGYFGLNLVNSLYFGNPPFGNDNMPHLLAAAGVFGAGTILSGLRKPYLAVGKKYSVHYVGLSTN